jgi:hypothetical protein
VRGVETENLAIEPGPWMDATALRYRLGGAGEERQRRGTQIYGRPVEPLPRVDLRTLYLLLFSTLLHSFSFHFWNAHCNTLIFTKNLALLKFARNHLFV